MRDRSGPGSAPVSMRTLVAGGVLIVSLNIGLQLGYAHLRKDQRRVFLAQVSTRNFETGPMVLIGDSIVRDLTDPYGRTVNLSVSGATAGWIAGHQTRQVAQLKPGRVILTAGIHDLRHRSDPYLTARTLLKLAGKLRSSPGASDLIILTILPISASAEVASQATLKDTNDTNALLSQMAAGHGVSVVSYSPLFAGSNGLRPELTYDGLHLTGRAGRVRTRACPRARRLSGLSRMRLTGVRIASQAEPGQRPLQGEVMTAC